MGSMRLMGGGLHRGTSTLAMGPAGVGPVVAWALHYAVRAATQGGHKAIIYLFDEEVGLLLDRAHGDSASISTPTSRPGGGLILEQVDAAELSPGEFAHKVCGPGRAGQWCAGRDRQPQRLPGGNAGRARPPAAHARAAALS